MVDEPAPVERVTLLVTCVGRRVELLQAFRAAARRLEIPLRIVGADQSSTAPALVCADEPMLLPPISDAGYVDALLDAAQRFGARALIPTIDTDLLPIAARRADFEALGCLPLIAERDVVAICRDKLETYRFLGRNGVDTPRTFTPDELRAVSAPRYPYLLKPRFGSASHSVHKIEDQRDLDYFLAKVPDPIVQEFVEGEEHTLDVYVGLTGKVGCVVPRKRLQVRAGEVSKAVVVKDREVMEAGRRVVELLGDSVRGLVTLQCIVTAERRIRFIEINARFGGGAPIGIAAGADYPGWLLEELCGRAPEIRFDGFRDGLCGARYDWAVFLPLGTELEPGIVPPMRDFPAFE